jgi:hypothetical protein
MTAYLFFRDASIELSVLCSLGGILALYGSFVLLTFDSELSVRQGTLSYRKGPFGRGATKIIEAKAIRSIGVETGSRTGGGYLHDIYVDLNDGSRQVIADLINDKQIADWIAFKIQAEIFGTSYAYPDPKDRHLRQDRDAIRKFANLNQAMARRISTSPPEMRVG